MPSDFLMYLLNGLIVVVWYLLRQKDEAQQEHINLLFRKHDEMKKDFADLKLHIAEAHYGKEELDRKLEKIEQTFRDGFADIGRKIDTLSKALIDHINRDR